jgi:hypothetical protein
MEEFVPFGSRTYLALLAVLLFARGMDFLSTWVATPNLVLEGNPIAKKLGWKWGIPINFALCLGFAFWLLPAVVIATTSVLVAARNFQGAWLMRSLGEQGYRQWHVERLREANISLVLGCLFGQTALTGLVGAVLVAGANWERQPILLGIGLGVIAYAAAVGGYSLLGIWRLRKADRASARRPMAEVDAAGTLSHACFREET